MPGRRRITRKRKATKGGAFSYLKGLTKSVGSTFSSRTGITRPRVTIPPVVVPPRTLATRVTGVMSGIRGATTPGVGSSSLATIVTGLAQGKSPQQLATDALFSRLSATGLPDKLDTLEEGLDNLDEIQDVTTEFRDNWDDIHD